MADRYARDERLIYEDKRYHGVIFVGNDYENIPRHAAFRAADSSDFKLDVSGSDKRFCFRLPYRECRVLRVFEGRWIFFRM